MSIRELERRMRSKDNWEDLGFLLEELMVQKPRIKIRDCWTKTEEGTVLISHPSLPYFFKLNRTATDIWEMCDGSKKIGDILNVLERTYSIDEAEKEKVLETILILFRLSLIEFSDEHESSSH